jgi:3-oxoacyl-[acyl-carrier protein] reductase
MPKSIPTTIKNKKLVKERRKQIILAAITLIEKKGFEKTTLRDLSKAAKISHGNMYDYIGSKEDIILLIHEFMCDLVDNQFEKVWLNVEDPLKRLLEMVKAEFAIQCQWAGAVLVIYQETHELNKVLIKQLLKREKHHISKYEIVLKDCVEKGIMRDVNVRVTVNLIKTIIDSWILNRWDLEGYISKSKMEKEIINWVLYGLLKR